VNAMSNSRKWTTDFNARKRELEKFTKPLRSAKARKEAMMLAAIGRPADLPQQARVSLALRRIAGFPSPARRAAMQGEGSK
jgi:hypothetical protein